MRSIDQALQLAELAKDPVVAMKNQTKMVNLLKRAKSEAGSMATGEQALSAVAVLERLERVLTRRGETLDELGVEKILRVDGVGPITPGSQSTPHVVEWPGGKGWARSMFATTLDGDLASLSRISVRITINGTDDLFTTGIAPAFTPLVAFAPSTHAWFRLAGIRGDREGYPVNSQERWSVTFKYEGPAGPASITPVLLFGYSRQHE